MNQKEVRVSYEKRKCMGERGMSLETFFNICQILDLDVNEVQEQCRKTLVQKVNRENEK